MNEKPYDLSLLPGRLQELREKHKLSQLALANELMIADNSVYKYESGETKPRIEQLIKYAEFFDVSLDWLCGGYDETHR